MSAQHNRKITQSNIKLPTYLKDWAKEQADNDFQSLSGFIAKLISEEKNRRESAINTYNSQISRSIHLASL
ncbi:hypothetical protein [Moraxella cuniculi]|uniref:Uncharacterized protein n=1 Tax=Moraxella cuniculi TaxID=34061 RepID=A0A3S4QRD6_9GAMM|nr:hypothetical protein [Moraxella cuniculi]VEG12510.1 Uncharacterised protein [Moraxella cuniculi]VEG13336.1 Uncharacterised protein [Moraxella cuniculi]